MMYTNLTNIVELSKLKRLRAPNSASRYMLSNGPRLASPHLGCTAVSGSLSELSRQRLVDNKYHLRTYWSLLRTHLPDFLG
jgi:hypothetical protein